jgi:hypothetical protein
MSAPASKSSIRRCRSNILLDEIATTLGPDRLWKIMSVVLHKLREADRLARLLEWDGGAYRAPPGRSPRHVG